MTTGRRLRQATGTVRFRVTALATLALVVVLAATGVGLVLAQERLLTDNLEETLEERADAIGRQVAAGDLPAVLPEVGDDDELAQVVTASGEVLAATPDLRGRPPIAEPPGDGQAVREVDDLDDGEALLVLSRTVGPGGGRDDEDDGDRDDDTDAEADDDAEAGDDAEGEAGDRDDDAEDEDGTTTAGGPGADRAVVVHVAAPTEDIGESTGALTRSLTVAIPAVALVLAALVWWLVGRTLRPVEAIRAEVADIGGAELHRRVPVPGGDDEIARLARTMNGMLDRVEDAARRQQRFVADASHELRSPLTRIRSEVEVDLAHPETGNFAATLASVRDEAVGLQRLVDDLLHLARSDAGAAEPRRRPVDLDDLVLRAARRLAAGDRVTVDTSGVAGAQIEGDPDQLARVVGNLTENAARHATSTVTLTLAEHDGEAVLAVADDGPGIPPEDRERVFDRFARLDDARHAVTGGTGLGLAIARDIVQRHGGTLAIDPDHAPGARFVVRLPTNGGA